MCEHLSCRFNSLSQDNPIFDKLPAQFQNYLDTL